MTSRAVGPFRGTEEPAQVPGNLSGGAEGSKVAPWLGLEILQTRLHIRPLPCRQVSQVLAQLASPAYHNPPALLDHL